MKYLLILKISVALAVIVSSKLWGQNLLLIRDKVGADNNIIKPKSNIKVVTLNNQTIKGRLALVKDSTIVIKNKQINEVNLNQIKYLYVRNNNGWKTAGGVFFAFAAADVTLFAIGGIIANQKMKQTQGVKDNLIAGIAGVAAIGLPALSVGAYYGLLHKKKYETIYRYNLLVIKE
ncbi:MAG: hypothetical protein IT239_06485 [Bacteroidia bacterium]|nr:hypothetical protein [Bacteroidia bacterium]